MAVVVTTNPGAWFEECLGSLAAQDYPNLSVLVIDTASRTDPTVRVAGVLPRAFVRHSTSTGFGAAANEVLELVEGASLFLFCHDDVALDADAVRACARFADDHLALVEPACGAALSLAYDDHPALAPYRTVAVIACGGVVVSLEKLAAWRAQFGV